MKTFSIEEFFEKYKLVMVGLVVAAFSVIFGLLATKLDGFKGIIVVGGIVFFAIIIFSLVNYRFGFYAAMTMGFFIFTIGRLTTLDIPIGLIVEIPLYCSLVGLLRTKYKAISPLGSTACRLSMSVQFSCQPDRTNLSILTLSFQSLCLSSFPRTE